MQVYSHSFHIVGDKRIMSGLVHSRFFIQYFRIHHVVYLGRYASNDMSVGGPVSTPHIISNNYPPYHTLSRNAVFCD